MVGAYNAFNAAKEAGCRRLVFASSIDVVMGYYRRPEVAWDAPVYPTNMYGATKCWGEALGRVYSDQHGLSCICVRLTSPTFSQSGDWDAEDLMSTTSPRDCAQLFGCCVDAADVGFAIVNGISRHRYPRLDLAISSRVVGYEPQDGTALPKI
jgi:dTDP-4-dehydrorhamnose reductase